MRQTTRHNHNWIRNTLTSTVLIALSHGGAIAQTSSQVVGNSTVASSVGGTVVQNAFVPNSTSQTLYRMGVNAAAGTETTRAPSLNGFVADNGTAAPLMNRLGLGNTANAYGVTGARSASDEEGDEATDNGQQVWVNGFGNWGEIDAIPGNAGYEHDGHGVNIGYTSTRDDDDDDTSTTLLGVQGGFGESNIDIRGGTDRVDVDSWNIGAHGGVYCQDGAYFQAVTGYIENDSNSRRDVIGAAVPTIAVGDFTGDEVYAYAEFGKTMTMGDDDDGDETAMATPGRNITQGLVLGGMDAPHSKGAHKDHKRVEHKAVEPAEEPAEEEEEEEVAQEAVDQWYWAPQVALQGRHFTQDAYTETGAGAANLAVNDVELDLFRTAVGARFFHVGQTDSGGTLVPELMLRYAHEFGDVQRPVTSSFVGTGTAFTTQGIAEDRDSLQVRLGATLYTVNDWKFNAAYNGEYGGNYENHAGEARVSYLFD